MNWKQQSENGRWEYHGGGWSNNPYHPNTIRLFPLCGQTKISGQIKQEIIKKRCDYARQASEGDGGRMDREHFRAAKNVKFQLVRGQQ